MRRRSRRLYLIFFALLIVTVGCGIKDGSASDVLRKYGLLDRPEPSRFQICKQFGCRGAVQVEMDPLEWNRVVEIFLPRPANAVEERGRIARAVALLETLAGELAGTSADVTMNSQAGPGQLDCVAESVNTSVYLLMLQERGLLTYHSVEAPQRRGTFIFYPHNTAVVREKGTPRLFAVDSWFGNNGDSPDMVPLDEWMRGWHPGDDAGTAKEAERPASTEREHGV